MISVNKNLRIVNFTIFLVLSIVVCNQPRETRIAH